MTVGKSEWILEYETRGDDKARLSALQLAKATDSYDRQLKKLQTSMSRNRGETKLYEKAIEDLNRDFTRLVKEGTNAGVALNQFGVQASRAQTKMKRFGSVGLQQVGYQVGDFAVQLQGGTNAAVAFGQQASQLLGIFGAGGAIAGAALAIGTAFVAPMLDAKKATEEAKTAVDLFRESIENLNEKSEEAKASLLAIQLGFESVEEAASTFAQAEKLRELLEIEKELAEVRSQPRGGRGGVSARESALEREKAILDAQLNSLIFQKEELNSIVESKRVALALAGSEQNEYENLVANAQRLAAEEREREKLRVQARKILYDMVAASSDFAQRVAEANQEVQGTEEALEDTKTIADKLLSTVNTLSFILQDISTINLATIFDSAIPSAASLAQVVAGIFTRGGRYGNAPEDPLDAFGGYGDFKYGTASTFRPPKVRSGGGGGGGGGGAAIEDTIGSLARQLLTEQEQVDLWREESLEKLEEFNKKELEILGGHAQARARIEEEYRERINDITESGEKNKLSTILGAGEQILSAIGTNNKKALKMAKVFGAAEALINTLVGASKELKEKGVIGIATAAAVIAQGIGFVNAIKSVNDSGASASAGAAGTPYGSAPSPTTSTAAPEPQRVIIEGIDENSVFTGKQLQNIFDAIYEENEDRGFVFQVGA